MATQSIDLNADLGENEPQRWVSDDAAMLDVVSSANVSCGFHAGTPDGIALTLRDAVQRGIAIGAHPGFADRANFGRLDRYVEPVTLQAQIEYQLGAVMGLAHTAGGAVRYVKPHGALYNMMARDAETAAVLGAAVRAIDATLPVLVLAGSAGTEILRERGITVVTEAFADRAYTPTGALVPRSQPDALLHDAEHIAERMVRLATTGELTATDGTMLRIAAESICVHGDNAHAVTTARAVRDALEAAGIAVRPFVAGPE